MCLSSKTEIVNHYENFTSRNYYFVESTLQNKLQNTHVLLLGAGLASQIASSLARVGVMNFTIIDSDIVECSNLNRQVYRHKDIDKFKAECLVEILQEINPNVTVHFVVQHISQLTPELCGYINNANIVINTLDYGASYFECVEYGRQYEKLIICPFNPCDAGMVVNFSAVSQSIYEFLDTDEALDSIDFPGRLRNLYVPDQLPVHVMTVYEELLPLTAEHGFFPQMILGAYITTAIVIECILKYLAGTTIPLAPTIIYREMLDSFFI